jgi:hypothetical protein
VLAAPFALILWGISRLVRKRAAAARTAAIVTGGTILFTPAWGPATIALVLIPFGPLLGVALVKFRWNELIDVMRFAPSWYAVAFPATALLIYGCRKLILFTLV